MPQDRKTGIFYELHGAGAPLFLAFPHMASFCEIFGETAGAMWKDYLDRLTDDYRVLLIDYPNIGKSHVPDPHDMTIDRVCADMLAVAETAGFKRFAWWGYTFGAVVGLHLASRSDRVSALVCGGWSPLGAQYDDMRAATSEPPPAHATAVLREPGQYAQWSTFYESFKDWREAEAVVRIACPKLLYYGANAEPDVGGGGRILRIAPTNRANRPQLEREGWTVTEIPDADNTVLTEPARVVPIVREFLDAVPRHCLEARIARATSDV
ncbi:MAG: alpha/beta fold hydrolase [Dongiaceae bacterium]